MSDEFEMLLKLKAKLDKALKENRKLKKLVSNKKNKKKSK